jgi:hypothetical protein
MAQDTHDPLSHTASGVASANAEAVDVPPPSLRPRPMGTAPVTPSEEFGPCLLFIPGEANLPTFTSWAIGPWDGEIWAHLDGASFVDQRRGSFTCIGYIQ